MLVAFAALLIHPQIAPRVPLSAEHVAFNAPVAVSGAANTTLEEAPLSANVSTNDSAQLDAELNQPLPDPPQPAVTMNANLPMAYLHPGNPMTVSVGELQAENRRKELMWRGLIVASSGAATFDAWTTRHAITTYGRQELNPMLKPFAGNASLYAAIQVGPLLMDYVGKKMMYSRHTWVRRMWWAPQTASFVSSLFCGSYNLSQH